MRANDKVRLSYTYSVHLRKFPPRYVHLPIGELGIVRSSYTNPRGEFVTVYFPHRDVSMVDVDSRMFSLVE